ncbi:MAG: ribose-5-phosphate isomerase RpiA [Rhabdochlamydiaceae bacterium]
MLIDKTKEQIGQKAAELVQEGMLVGLGTGSTTFYFIKALADRYHKENINIKTVASSSSSELIAKNFGLPLIETHAPPFLDIVVDGADEIDLQKQLIKGAGGALFREKILASITSKLVIIADESKLVSRLGELKPLPVEVLPFASFSVEKKCLSLGLKGQWRKVDSGSYLKTDNGNCILDLFIQKSLFDLKKLEENLISTPGIVSTGLFLDFNPILIIGKKDGTYEYR